MITLLNTFAQDFGQLISSAKDILLNFSIGDAIEVAVLSLLFFLVVRFLRGKKAGVLLIGIAVCVLAVVLSNIFEFKVLHTVFNSIIEYGTLVIIVIFQPEIRDALEKIGSGSIKGIMNFSDRRKKKELYYTVIENICEAVKELSAESTGALIVIERTTGLSDIVQTGIIINADVNSSLLRNLFYNRAPLHDGAVVISDGRVAAAGCFLPLTRRSDVDPSLGTRHRAAIGMSESSDALIIVVSEETGAISVAHDCKLDRNLTVDALKNFLSESILRTSGNASGAK